MSKDAPLSIDVATLPDDVAALKQLFVEERRQRDALIARIREEAATQLEAQAAQLEAKHAAEMKAAITALLRRYYGPRSESFDPRQLLLFGQKVEQMPLDPASIAEESGEAFVTRRVKNRDKHGRQQLPESLERIEIEHDLDDKSCPACGQERSRIGAEVSEQLEYFPASFKVLKHIRHKYACGKCDADGYNPNIVAASKPSQPIDKGLPGPSLFAYVTVSKLGDHLPLYRLENIFARQQVHVARSTMCAWMAAGRGVGQAAGGVDGRRGYGNRGRSTPTTRPCRSSRPARSNAAKAASGATWATKRIRTRSTTTRPAATATARPLARRFIEVIC